MGKSPTFQALAAIFMSVTGLLLVLFFNIDSFPSSDKLIIFLIVWICFCAFIVPLIPDPFKYECYGTKKGKCAHCGVKIKGNEKFCTNCGSVLGSAD